MTARTPVLRDRDERELALAAALMLIGVRQTRIVVDLIRQQRNGLLLTGDVWAALAREVAEALIDPLTETYRAAAASHLERAGLRPAFLQDTDLLIAASAWATARAARVGQDISLNSETAVRGALTGITNETPLKAIAPRVARVFALTRWQQLASTEITEVISGAAVLVVATLAARGQQTREVWETYDDGCPVICRPLQGKAIDDIGQRPPAHPNCDCGTRISVIR